MGKLIILNGSPRAAKSNSKRYAEIFSQHYQSPVEYFNISKQNHNEISDVLSDCSDVLLVFPLYVDGIPVTLLNFLKTLEKKQIQNTTCVSVLVNCDLYESEQNDVAVEMIKLFCRQNGWLFGSTLRIGSGEAILDTPFKFMVVSKIKKLCHSIYKKEYQELHTSMPITKKMYLKASTTYWINYGKKNGITEEQMKTMQIE